MPMNLEIGMAVFFGYLDFQHRFSQMSGIRKHIHRAAGPTRGAGTDQANQDIAGTQEPKFET